MSKKEGSCDKCVKWFRLNAYKGTCADVMNWHDTTYEADWCENFVPKNNINSSNTSD